MTRLYVHSGMPKTGTSSLQRLLSANERELAAQGYEYPTVGRARFAVAHHQLATAVLAEGRGGPVIREFLDYLPRAGSENVIVSSEALTNALNNSSLGRLQDFLEDCSRSTSVTVLVTLRRFDAFIVSTYLQQIKWRSKAASIDRFANARLKWVDGIFASIATLRDDPEGCSMRILTYQEGADAVTMVLDAMGLAPDALGVERRARVNTTLGKKAQSMLGSLDALRAELGDDVDRRELVRLFESGEFEFDDEVFDYDVMDRAERVRVHEYALERARARGIEEYVSAFENATIEHKPVLTPSRDAISDQDVAKLKRFLDERRGDRPRSRAPSASRP